MHETQLFIGEIRPLPQSRRPTGFYKQALETSVLIGPLGLAGDQQADLRVHGGPEKAVHLYPARHYARLAQAFPTAAAQLLPGSMGENISLDDLDESQVFVGERFALGGAILQLCQPRNPCWKIDERFDVDGMAAFIAEQGLTGWYFRVSQTGEARSGDRLRPLDRPPGAPNLRAAMRCWQEHRPTPEALEAIAATPGIAQHWQDKIVRRAAWLRANPDSAPPPVTTFHVKPDPA